MNAARSNAGGFGIKIKTHIKALHPIRWLSVVITKDDGCCICTHVKLSVK